MSGHEKTITLVTNLDRAGIEARLSEFRRSAIARDLPDLASLFVDVEGMPRAQIEQRVRNALKWLAERPELNRLTTQLELIEVNLPNLR